MKYIFLIDIRHTGIIIISLMLYRKNKVQFENPKF